MYVISAHLINKPSLKIFLKFVQFSNQTWTTNYSYLGRLLALIIKWVVGLDPLWICPISHVHEFLKPSFFVLQRQIGVWIILRERESYGCIAFFKSYRLNHVTIFPNPINGNARDQLLMNVSPRFANQTKIVIAKFCGLLCAG